jgi:sarcosine oxidase delta subunit
VALVFSGAEGTQDGSTLIIKPLLTLIVETHTSQSRMRTTMEHHIEQTARDDFGNAVFVRKNLGGVDLQEWQSEDGARRIVTAFINTAVIIGNDETAVLHAVEAATSMTIPRTDALLLSVKSNNS